MSLQSMKDIFWCLMYSKANNKFAIWCAPIIFITTLPLKEKEKKNKKKFNETYWSDWLIFPDKLILGAKKSIKVVSNIATVLFISNALFV